MILVRKAEDVKRELPSGLHHFYDLHLRNPEILIHLRFILREIRGICEIRDPWNP